MKIKTPIKHYARYTGQATTDGKPSKKVMFLSETPPTASELWQRCKPVTNYFKPVKRWYTLWLKDHKSAEQIMFETKKDAVVLIRMELNNGRFTEFFAVEKEGSFFYKDCQYIMDLQQKFYLIERDIWAYDFHESMSLPIRKNLKVNDDIEELLTKIEEASRLPKASRVPVDDIKTIIDSANLIDTETSLNPRVLRNFTIAELAKQIMQGAMLGKIFKIMFILVIVIAIIALINLIVSLYASGVFEKIGNMF
jgi:hypothetical protein